MNEIKNQPKRNHSVILNSRNKMSIDGVEDVVSFDETQVELVTACGEMTVEGNGLHITTLALDSGTVELDGKIDGIFYSEPKAERERGGFFSGLFR